ncbi:MAG: thioredoxin family protein [Pyramidobacter sp.]|nr:thioredoxin family protein [Pyramidobacter sp.]
MKKITMFMFEGCPHCRKALALIDELKAAHPEYADVPFEMIDEKKDPATAEKYDYYYVPTFYVDGEKIHEGSASAQDVEKVFQTARA